VFLAFLIIFTIIFFGHKKDSSRTIKIMEKYNELQNFNKITNFSKIESVIKEDKTDKTKYLEKVYNYLSNKKNILDKILNVCYNNIKKLQNLSFSYQKKQERKLIKIIIEDLASAESIKNKIANAYTKNDEYINANSEIYMQMVTLYNNLEDFYKTNLIDGANEVLNRKMEEFLLNIRGLMGELKQEGEYIEYEVFKQKSDAINIFFHDTIKTVLPYYKFKKIAQYFKEVNSKIEELLPTLSTYGFSNEEITQIKQQKVIGEGAIDKLENNLAILNFSEVDQQARIACTCLEKTLNNILYDQDVKKTIKTDLILFNECVNTLEKRNQDIFLSITNLENNFGIKDQEINDSLQKIRNDYGTIVERKKIIERDMLDNSMTNFEIINGIKSIINNILA
jgi:hypothetical protein